MAVTPQGHVAIQEGLCRWEKWADGILIKFSKEKYTWGRITPYTSTHWGLSSWKAAWQNRTPERLVDTVGQQYAAVAKAAKARIPWT